MALYENEKTHNPIVPHSAMVMIRRTVKSVHEVNEHGPMSLRDAISRGLTSSASGTVSVSITLAEGEEYAGATVFRKNGLNFANVELYSDGSRVPDITLPE